LHFFFQDVSKKVEERGDAFISEMTPDERCVYEEQAQKDKQNVHQLVFKNKHCPWRRHCAQNERVPNLAKRQMRMTQEIEERVTRA
jgi:hypothetical protein